MLVDYAKVFSQTKELTLLFIEDDANFQQETKEIFKDLFFHVDTASDGKDGLEKYTSYYENTQKYYDIIVTDINMPKIDGIELIEKIYSINKDQSVIVLSAHNESKYLLKLINIGIEQLLIKPFDYNEILDVFYHASAKIVKNNSPKQEKEEPITIELEGELVWNREDNQLFKNNDIIKLTKNETILMDILIKNNSHISTIDEISAVLFPNREKNSILSALKPLVSRLRKKINPQTIESIYGLGYRISF